MLQNLRSTFPEFLNINQTLMRNLLLILSFIFLISCHQKSPAGEEIEIFNNFTFTLKDSETSKPLSDQIHKDYDSLTARKELQIPLFKYIESSDYKIYLGIPYKTSLKTISKQALFPGTLRTANKEKGGKYTYKTYTAYGAFLAEYSENLDGNLVYILGVSQSKPLADSVFSLESISNRIQKPE